MGQYMAVQSQGWGELLADLRCSAVQCSAVQCSAVQAPQQGRPGVHEPSGQAVRLDPCPACPRLAGELIYYRTGPVGAIAPQPMRPTNRVAVPYRALPCPALPTPPHLVCVLIQHHHGVLAAQHLLSGISSRVAG